MPDPLVRFVNRRRSLQNWGKAFYGFAVPPQVGGTDMLTGSRCIGWNC
jgi:hypothetical protein